MKPEPGTLRRWPLVIYLLACTLILQASPARRGLVNLTQPDGSVDYVKGANIAGFMKVAQAMLEQGTI